MVSSALVLGCSDDTVDVTVNIVVGQETDTFTREPAVTRIDIVATTSAGDVQASASTTPGGSFDLGDLPTDDLVEIAVQGFDAAGNVVVRGRSIPISLAGATGGALPVFVQRTGTFARPPEGLAAGHDNAATTVFAERFLLATGGDEGGATTMDYYDLAVLGPAETTALSFAAQTIVTQGTLMLALDDESATWLDFESGTRFAPTWPTGLAGPGDVADGSVIFGSGGSAYVVGPTSPSGPRQKVLGVSSAGALSASTTITARRGAASLWVDGKGLWVIGGSAEGSGAELLASAGAAFQALPLPSDGVEGAGACVLGERVLLAGGTDGGVPAPLRLLDPACVTDCAPQPLGFGLPLPLTSVRAYGLDSTRALVVGAQTTSVPWTTVYLVDTGSETAVEVPLREPRIAGRPEPTPTGGLAILGGHHEDGSPALSVELYLP